MGTEAGGGPVRRLSELAALAGVSPGTVSRALSGRGLVSPATGARIRALADRHGFRPNEMASRLRTGATRMVGAVVPLGHARGQHLSDPFFATMLAHLADAVTERGYDLLLKRVIPDTPDWLDRIVASGMLEGVALIGQSDQWPAIEQVAVSYRPLVAWGSRLPGQRHCSIGTDNFAGGRLAAAHLTAKGARRFLFIGDIAAPELGRRFEGFAASLADAGLCPPALLPAPLGSVMAEAAIWEGLAAHGTAIDGIFAGADVLAAAALRALAGQGRRVPADVRVIGFDDLPIAAETAPPLTTIRQDIRAGAERMVAALFARMDGAEAQSYEAPPELVVRLSA